MLLGRPRSVARADAEISIQNGISERFDMAGFKGRYALVPIGPCMFEYYPDDADPFSFTSSDGTYIQPPTMLTDGASVPRPFWFKKWLGPVDWLNAAVIHDAMFEEEYRKINHWTFPQANRIMREACAHCGVPWLERWAIWLAVTIFGYPIWRRSGMVVKGSSDEI